MNWRIKELDGRSIVSFSDAHSGPKIGREATVFELPQLNYENICQAISQNTQNIRKPENQTIRNSEVPIHRQTELSESSGPHIAYTIEFYPEEGKYHWSGHRACNIRRSPDDTKKNGEMCPVCGKPMTQGVEQRVGELASRSEAELQVSSIKYQASKDATVSMTVSKVFPKRPPFVMFVPLQEIIAECIGSPVASPKVQTPYRQLTDTFNGEFNVLLQAQHVKIAKIAGERVAVGIDKVREGDIAIDPGYDGVFGVVKIWREDEEKPLIDASKEQLSIF